MPSLMFTYTHPHTHAHAHSYTHAHTQMQNLYRKRVCVCVWVCVRVCMWVSVGTGWRRCIGCLKLQVSFRKRTTKYRALFAKEPRIIGLFCGKRPLINKASYGSSPLSRHEWRYICICIYVCMTCKENAAVTAMCVAICTFVFTYRFTRTVTHNNAEPTPKTSLHSQYRIRWYLHSYLLPKHIRLFCKRAL